MKLDEHMESTLMKIGEQHKELHVALDFYFPDFDGSMHWLILHHRKGIDLMEKRFGRGVRRAAEIHIKDDLGFIPDSPVDPRLLSEIYFKPELISLARELLVELFDQDFDFIKFHKNL